MNTSAVVALVLGHVNATPSLIGEMKIETEIVIRGLSEVIAAMTVIVTDTAIVTSVIATTVTIDIAAMTVIVIGTVTVTVEMTAIVDTSAMTEIDVITTEGTTETVAKSALSALCVPVRSSCYMPSFVHSLTHSSPRPGRRCGRSRSSFSLRYQPPY